jgi:hypothetical protein
VQAGSGLLREKMRKSAILTGKKQSLFADCADFNTRYANI